MSEPRWQRVLSVAGLGVALALLTAGSRRTYEVDPSPEVVRAAQVPAPPPWEMPSFAPGDGFPPPKPPPPLPRTMAIDDVGLIVNATFTGVVRKDDRLQFTYDPTKKGGKRSCPT